jgi:hypothetical protein
MADALARLSRLSSAGGRDRKVEGLAVIFRFFFGSGDLVTATFLTAGLTV